VDQRAKAQRPTKGAEERKKAASFETKEAGKASGSIGEKDKDPEREGELTKKSTIRTGQARREPVAHRLKSERKKRGAEKTDRNVVLQSKTGERFAWGYKEHDVKTTKERTEDSPQISPD